MMLAGAALSATVGVVVAVWLFWHWLAVGVTLLAQAALGALAALFVRDRYQRKYEPLYRMGEHARQAYEPADRLRFLQALENAPGPNDAKRRMYGDALTDADPAVRLFAALQLDDESVLDDLIDEGTAPDDVRMQALASLLSSRGDRFDTGLAERLVPWLSEPGARLRNAALTTLLGWRYEPAMVDLASAVDDAPELRDELLSWVEEHAADTAGAWLALLGSQDHPTRRAAAEHLAEVGTPDAIAALKSAAVRLPALRATIDAAIERIRERHGIREQSGALTVAETQGDRGGLTLAEDDGRLTLADDADSAPPPDSPD